MAHSFVVLDDLLRDLNREEYENACMRFRELSNKCGIGDDRIGFFGTVSCPGISDIDSLVVADFNSIKLLQNEFSEARRKSERFSYLFWHNPVYVLEDAWEEAQSLHTLNGLKFLAYSEDLQGAVDARRDDSNWLLYVVWFTFLCSVVSGLRRRGEASLRMLLLVQKNLEYSFEYFSEACVSRLNTPMSSDELRDTVFKNPHSDKQWVASLLFSQFDVACRAFDQFCRLNSPRLPQDGRYGRWQVANRRMIIKNSTQTSLTTGAQLSVIEANSLAFALASSFWNSQSAPAFMGDYIRTFYRTQGIYQKWGLVNAFISPFAMSISSRKAPVMRVINRLAQTLT